MSEPVYEFEIEQDGMIVAGGTGPGMERMMSEARHYEMMYGQDGPCVMRFGRAGALRRVRKADLALPPWYGQDQELLAQREYEGEA